MEAFTRKYASDPRGFDPANPATHPLHSTGGAIDVVLRRHSSGALIDLGTYFDDPDEKSHTHFYERELQAGRIARDDERLLHRRALYGAMTQAGFTNYPYEFWHYDYGNRMYACMMRRLGAKLDLDAIFTYLPPPLRAESNSPGDR